MRKEKLETISLYGHNQHYKTYKVEVKMRTYEQIRPDLQTGDEVLCGGKGWISLLIKIVTLSWVSHVGKIFIDSNGCVWIWHSTSLAKGKSGPQREQFRTFLKSYQGRVEVRHLKFVGPLNTRPQGFQQTYIDTIKEFKDKEYENNYMELAGSVMPWKNKANLTSIFCSEMTAEIDMRTGILVRSVPANEYIPKDSLPGKAKDYTIKTESDAFYTKPIRLK